MRVYVGYVLIDTAVAVCLGLDKNTVEKKTASYGWHPYWVKEYDLSKNKVFELDND